MEEEHPRLPIEKLWEATLTDLQASLTRATFDTWIRGTHASHLEDEVLVITTPTPFGLEWLQERLRRPIETALARHKHTGGVKFIIAPTAPAVDVNAPLAEVAQEVEVARPPTSKAILELMDFDPTTRGWVQTPAYSIQFWQPYLGQPAFNLWLTIRSFGQGETWPSIATLADILCKGNKQKLIGRTVGEKYQPGLLEVLEAERVIWYKRKGSQYLFRVLDRLPLLTPHQVAKLSKVRQRAHTKFLSKSDIDFREWQQLTLASLSKGVQGG